MRIHVVGEYFTVPLEVAPNATLRALRRMFLESPEVYRNLVEPEGLEETLEATVCSRGCRHLADSATLLTAGIEAGDTVDVHGKDDE